MYRYPESDFIDEVSYLHHLYTYKNMKIDPCEASLILVLEHLRHTSEPQEKTQSWKASFSGPCC